MEREKDTTTRKQKKVSFTINGNQKTKKLLDELQWFKQYAITRQQVTQAEIIQEALELLSKKMGWSKAKKYSDTLKSK